MSFPLPEWARATPSLAPERWRRRGLGPRLAALAEAVAPETRVADVGTDHALLPEALLAEQHVRAAVGCDRAPAPLAAARRRLEDPRRRGPAVELRQGEGLEPLSPGEFDVVVLAGFGGPRMLDLLSARWPESIGVRTLVLQPTAGLPRLRAELSARGGRVREENIVREGDRGFVTSVVELGHPPRALSPFEALRGWVSEDEPLLRAWLESQLDHLTRSRRGDLAEEVRAWLYARTLDDSTPQKR
ncbi:MAG: tRNA (adenine(22)-N(1))-methyltransferase TrmK [Myxococcota bacterium]